MTLVFLFLGVIFPFVMMPLMWRRMKKVQRQVRDKQAPAPAEPSWEERLEARDGLQLSRTSSPNEALIDLGAKARETRWPIENG